MQSKAKTDILPCYFSMMVEKLQFILWLKAPVFPRHPAFFSVHVFFKTPHLWLPKQTTIPLHLWINSCLSYSCSFLFLVPGLKKKKKKGKKRSLNFCFLRISNLHLKIMFVVFSSAVKDVLHHRFFRKSRLNIAGNTTLNISISTYSFSHFFIVPWEKICNKDVRASWVNTDLLGVWKVKIVSHNSLHWAAA